MSAHLELIFERKIQICIVASEEVLKIFGFFREANEILDMGSGIGAPIHYYYKKILNVDF